MNPDNLSPKMGLTPDPTKKKKKKQTILMNHKLRMGYQCLPLANSTYNNFGNCTGSGNLTKQQQQKHIVHSLLHHMYEFVVI